KIRLCANEPEVGRDPDKHTEYDEGVVILKKHPASMYPPATVFNRGERQLVVSQSLHLTARPTIS
ncbi:MAG TPA: hypothetical protein V6D08_08145, partial [Candidatus Obscuribacterales bacterium]